MAVILMGLDTRFDSDLIGDCSIKFFPLLDDVGPADEDALSLARFSTILWHPLISSLVRSGSRKVGPAVVLEPELPEPEVPLSQYSFRSEDIPPPLPAATAEAL